ncbi:MAG: hypothetical protein JWQ04_2970 [Pedosphaera sp.]|nr:hypothetical protein [Pedosphaera sp.]
MKWIAKRDFYRTPKLMDIQITGACKGASATAPHPKCIHRGAIFELGKAANEAELQKGKDPQKALIAQLRVAGCMGDASDAEVVARIESEIATDAKREAAHAAMNKEANTAAIAAAFMEVIRLAQRRANAAQ